MYYECEYFDAAMMKRKNLNRVVRGVFMRMPQVDVQFRSYTAHNLFDARCKELDDDTIKFIVNNPKGNVIVMAHLMDNRQLRDDQIRDIIHSGLPKDDLLMHLKHTTNAEYARAFAEESAYIRKNYFDMVSATPEWRNWLLDMFKPEAFQTYQTNAEFFIELARHPECPMNILLNLLNNPDVTHELNYSLSTIISDRNLRITEPMSIIPYRRKK